MQEEKEKHRAQKATSGEEIVASTYDALQRTNINADMGEN